ncbi:SDR family NAD(P)-dependent oxidoreductase [Xanthobacter dioxanivorans]|uniref:SDR family NAD(P)-dependent oxidoreductase n=1 Tax=Xanthobacter dioxanivorans TaxID=2528964 RepID=A0A974SGI1_9HYPH|nr:SDR family NAD(P)-dependent oxidoreductase [Xanthobacter dioxanivorans]QRG05291.1 SDR family NAD(P)-dependent oxidoreductase [Xanthobacter dioxanivorans]
MNHPLAVISGGSSGIGLACARLLGGEGCRVALLGRDEARLAAAAGALRAEGIAVEARCLDVRDGPRCARVVDALAAEFGPPLWVIASAGIVEPGFFLDQDPALLEEQVATNLLGTCHLVRAAAPAMAEAGRGHIILVSSGAGLFGVAGYGGYCATKFAVRGLGEVLRIELAAAGVGVTVAVPPDTDTPQLAHELSRRPRAIAAFAAGGPPLSAEAVARHMIRTARRGGFLSAPSWKLRAIAALGDLVRHRLAAIQMRLLVGRRAP